MDTLSRPRSMAMAGICPDEKPVSLPEGRVSQLSPCVRGFGSRYNRSSDVNVVSPAGEGYDDVEPAATGPTKSSIIMIIPVVCCLRLSV